MMQTQLTFQCQQHPDLSDCGDSLIGRLNSGEIGIRIHDGGDSMVAIRFCPWCGQYLR